MVLYDASEVMYVIEHKKMHTHFLAHTRRPT